MTVVDEKIKCPGLYCGRQMISDSINGSMGWSECGACPRGYRVSIVSEYSHCMPCENNPSTYDWLYLGFMAMLPLILHWFFIDLAAKERWFVCNYLFDKQTELLLNSKRHFDSNLVLPKVKSFYISAHSLKCWHQLLSHC